jgi:rare lipoprotein A
VQVHGLTAADIDSDQRVAREDATTSGTADITPVTVVQNTLASAGGPSDEASTRTTTTNTRHPHESGNPSATTASPKSNKDWRFDMRQDGRTMTADEFDAWMRARQARVATGKPQPADDADDANVAATTSVAIPASRPVVAAPAADAITLQVASFAARANAERALAMVTGAGIDNARLLDADANGRKVWRLRVGPVDSAVVAELGQRLQGLGFGPPQRVRE